MSRVVDTLLNDYKDSKCALDYDSTFHLLIAVVLSAQTTDVAVNKVTPLLFKAAPDAYSMAALSQQEIASYIKTIGMYNTKSKNVKALSQKLCDEYEGQVPGDFDELVKLPGVGRKTANVVLAECFGAQKIAVDTHVFRLANRIGLCDEKDVLKTEFSLMKDIPESCWTKMHHALIWHGRKVCTAQNPDCSNCCISEFCLKKGVRL